MQPDVTFFDIECDSLTPTKVWVIVCKDLATGEYHVFRNPSEDDCEKARFQDYMGSGSPDRLYCGHNVVGFDIPVLAKLMDVEVPISRVVDTFIVSKMVDYSRPSHSLESYGEEFGLPKIDFKDWSYYSKEMEEYCVRDVDISHRAYNKYRRYISNPDRYASIDIEQRFQAISSELHHNGFGFDSSRCSKLLLQVRERLDELDTEILSAFPPKEVVVREFTPKATKFGTISRTSVPRSLWHNIENYKVGETYKQTKLVEFNPASHKQIIDVLNSAGWSPTEKTDTYKDVERSARRKDRNPSIDWDAKLSHLKIYGWKINETNLSTLPPRAPAPARILAKRILYEARRRTLTEWLSLVDAEGRIHGQFLSMGAWTHRMAHQKPNTANIPNEKDTQGLPKLLGGEMRSLWIAPAGRLLVGVDAEGIQLRIFAHYIDDEEFTHEVSSGDPHSLNQRILGSVCRDRSAAKRFIYALLLGGGLAKLAFILQCGQKEAQESLDRLLLRYTGFARLKATIIPVDGKRGYFYGLDGRAIRIPGDTASERRHLAMSGYLQAGEAVVMKHATLLWHERLTQKGIDFKLVNMVHDEWQTECPADRNIALAIAMEQAEAIKEIGVRLNLRCPLAGSYINKDLLKKGDPFPYTIGKTWKVTH